MLSILTRTGRLAAAHWPALLAWFLAGWLARYLLIELAAWVGASTLLGGLLIMPLAILARLISFVAMFLVLKPGMPALQALGGETPATRRGRTRRHRRAEFQRAVLASILPFFAFYAAWGFLRDDMHQYSRSALDNFTATNFGTGRSFADVDQLGFDATTISIIVLAFAGRWALGRYASRLPRWVSLIGVYLEAMWVFLTVYLISDLLGSISAWFDSRQAMVWLDDARGWLAEVASPLIWVWDAAAWAVGEIGGLVLLPLAWLTIAGVIYGQSVPAGSLAAPARLGAVRRRYDDTVPAWLRRRLADLGMQFVRRFRPVWRAMLTIWRAGAIPMGIYILVYTIVAALQGWIAWGIIAALGPHDLHSFWMIADALIALAALLIVEPLRVALVAAAYDHAIGGAPAAAPGASASGAASPDTTTSDAGDADPAATDPAAIDRPDGEVDAATPPAAPGEGASAAAPAPRSQD